VTTTTEAISFDRDDGSATECAVTGVFIAVSPD
jgi:hypothetical protein